MKRAVWFCILLSVVCTAFVAGAVSKEGNVAAFRSISRKLKEGGFNGDHVSLDDYLPVDPSPSSSSKAVIPGPIEHGTPLIPYIPRPSPPISPSSENYP